jgi:hypothetical protein
LSQRLANIFTPDLQGYRPCHGKIWFLHQIYKVTVHVMVRFDFYTRFTRLPSMSW